MKRILAALLAASFMATASAAWAACEDFSGGIALCDVPETWFKSPNAEAEDQATYMINGQTFAIMSFGPGAHSPTEAIERALASVADKFKLDVNSIEQVNSGASGIDGISAVFVDYRVPMAGNWLFYRTTTAWGPNLTPRLTTYGFDHALAEDFDAIHKQLVAATELAK